MATITSTAYTYDNPVISTMKIKGYVTPFGFMGLVEGRYILFATEEEYYEYLKED